MYSLYFFFKGLGWIYASLFNQNILLPSACRGCGKSSNIPFCSECKQNHIKGQSSLKKLECGHESILHIDQLNSNICFQDECAKKLGLQNSEKDLCYYCNTILASKTCVSLKCGNLFHFSCISNHLSSQVTYEPLRAKGDASCPKCKQVLQWDGQKTLQELISDTVLGVTYQAIHDGNVALVDKLCEVPTGPKQLPYIHAAAFYNQKEIIKILSHKGDGVDAKSNQGYTALQFMTAKGNFEIVKNLVEMGADLEAKDNDGNSLLHHAARMGQSKLVAWLAENCEKERMNIDIKNNENWTPLFMAAAKGNYETMIVLLKYGANINIGDKSGNSLLHHSAAVGDIEKTKVLIEMGANLELKNVNGSTPLHTACLNGQIEIIKFLVIEMGANLESKNNQQQTPLRAAIMKNLETVKTIIELGADVNCADSQGFTAIHAAINIEEIGTEIVKLLLEKGANIGVKAIGGYTPLHVAAIAGKKEILKIFVESGSNFEDKNDDGNTALHFAASCGHLTIVKELIEIGAKVTARNEQGNTALYEAAKDNQIEIIKWLVEEGKAEVRITNERNKTPLMAAEERGHEEVVAYLKSKGA